MPLPMEPMTLLPAALLPDPEVNLMPSFSEPRTVLFETSMPVSLSSQIPFWMEPVTELPPLMTPDDSVA